VQHLRLDPEDELARVVGDVAAVRLMQGARAAADSLRDTAQRMAGNAAEYLAEESAVLVGRALAADWQDGVAQTRAACDALAARLSEIGLRLDRARRVGRSGGES
jgi:ubiquinone biosynthesis protein UbiJ